MREAAHHTFIPTQDGPASGRILLRDGSAAELRLATSEDHPALERFFAELSEKEKDRQRFASDIPLQQRIAERTDNSNPSRRLTLVVTRLQEERAAIIATGTYVAQNDEIAEVSVVVADEYLGKGLGTLLLERLGLLAIRHGFRILHTVARGDRERMRQVYRDSGFDVVEQSTDGAIGIDLQLQPTAASVAKSGLRDRLATVASLRPFFLPRAVAVVGASRDTNHIGHKILQGLIDAGFPGPIYPVNPKADELLGLKVYASPRDLPKGVDLAIMAIPARAMIAAVDAAAAAGIRAIVVITAGFAEVHDPNGHDLQRHLLEKVRGHGMRMIGPNCLGVINTDPQRPFNGSFSPIFPPAGRIAMSSQSGALGLAVLAAARRLGLGLSTFVSVGNKADVSGNDLLQYWEEDPQTDVILLYLESFGNARRFARIAGRVSKAKPILAIKGGRGKAGARAASSHSAALASKEVAVDALFRQTGVLRVETLEEMFDVAAGLAHQPLPQGKRVAILTNAGGAGILCADMCESVGLELPVLVDTTQASLRAFLPGTASVGNPVDMVASAPPEHYRRAIEVLLTCEEIDALVVIYIPVGFGENATYFDAIGEGLRAGRARGSTKTVLGCWMSASNAIAPTSEDDEPLPAFEFPESPARVLGHMTRYAAWRSRPDAFIPELDGIRFDEARHLRDRILREQGPGWLTLPECFELLDHFGLPTAAWGLATSEEEAISIAEKMGYPVVLKLSSRQLVHKTDLGVVKVNLADAGLVRQAFRSISDAAAKHHLNGPGDGILVQKMAPPGIEVMCGATSDPQFGPLLGFGLGGVMIEAMGDICFRIAPVTVADAREMLRTPKSSVMLRGFRGSAPCDLAVLEEVILRLSRLVDELPEVKELDLNPILAYPKGQGCLLIDARIRLEPLDPTEHSTTSGDARRAPSA